MNRNLPKIISLLEKEYGRAYFPPEADPPRFMAGAFRRDPLSELMATVLSQNTTDQNRDRAYKNLTRLGSWRNLSKLSERKIERAIHSGGLGNVKARRIKEILVELRRRTGKIDLSFLRREPTNFVLKFLRSLKGVGPKTAACTALFSFRRPVMPVDTHILRVTKRIGLVPLETTLEKAHALLGRIVPKDEKIILTFHSNLIEHGRMICKPRKPRCGICVVNRCCNYYKSVWRQAWK